MSLAGILVLVVHMQTLCSRHRSQNPRRCVFPTRCLQSSLETSPELRQTKSRIERDRTELAAAKSELLPKVDALWLQRWSFPSDENAVLEEDRRKDGSAGETTQSTEIKPPAFEARHEIARFRRMQLRVIRENANLREREKVLTNKLVNAIAKTEDQYLLVRTSDQRCRVSRVSEREVSARSAEYIAARSPVNVILQSQERHLMVPGQNSLLNHNLSPLQTAFVISQRDLMTRYSSISSPPPF